MGLIAHLAADAASFSLRGDGAAAGFETPWHRAVLRLEDEAGNILKSVEAFADGRLDVRGGDDEPHDSSIGELQEPVTESEHADATEEDPLNQPEPAKAADDGTDTGEHPGDGFKGFSQHADGAKG